MAAKNGHDTQTAILEALHTLHADNVHFISRVERVEGGLAAVVNEVSSSRLS